MQPTTHISYTKKDGTAILTISRPEVRNAMLPLSWSELEACMDEAERDPAIRAVVVTGAGEKAFASGGDVHALKERRPLSQFYDARSSHVIERIERVNKPVIAAINGAAVGGGAELALGCDIRIASPNAKFCFPELGLGILPGAGGTQRLARILGLGRAKELIMTGKACTAQEALAWGLIMEVVPQENLLARAVELAQKMAQKGPVAMGVVKQVLNRCLDADLHTGLLLEQLGFVSLLYTEDREEGMSAFLEKRAPQFKGE